MTPSPVQAGVTTPASLPRETRPAVQNPVPQMAIHNRKKYEWLRPMPYYVSGILAVVFTITAIANLLLLQLSRALTFACAGCTFFLLTRTINSYPHLVETVQQLEAALRFLHEKIGHLQQAHLSLHTEENALEKLLKCESVGQQKLAQAIQEQGTRFETVNLRLDNLAGTVTKTMELKIQWNEISQKIESEVTSFKETSQAFVDHDKKMTLLMANLAEMTQKTALSISEGQSLVTQLGAAREAWSAQFQKMSQELGELQTDFVAKSTGIEALLDSTRELKEANQRYDALVQKFLSTQTSIERILERFEQIKKSYTLVEEKIQLITKETSLERVQALATEARTLLLPPG